MVPAPRPGSVTGPTPEEIAQNWPGFRGPGGVGVAVDGKAPLSWEAATGRGILWKADIPLPGENSPVVWGDRVFLCGADSKRQEVYGFDAATGKLLWKQAVSTSASAPGPAPQVSDDCGYAPSTVATDGRYVCAIFPTGDVAGLDYTGKLLWARNLGPLDNQYGAASSPVMYQGRLLLQLDQGSSPQDGKSALVALDASSGQTVWRTLRPSQATWSSPILVSTGAREELIAAGNPWVAGYDPVSGAELWRAKGLSGDVAPSPAYAAGRIFVAEDGAALIALPAGQTGVILAGKFLWAATDNLPDIVSPLATADCVFLATSEGTVTCYDAARGAKLWEHDLGAEVKSSPTLVGGNVYLLDTGGVMHIFAAARQWKEISTGKLGEAASASPAFVGSKIFLRGKTRLYCVGAG
jgi:outer membrane protein assembly factor BamB